jgi:hypothetical protein
MKKIIVIAAVLLTAATQCLMAQEESRVSIPSGYRAFIEEENSMQLVSKQHSLIGVGTTHGFYMNDKCYVGLGFTLQGNEDCFLMPIYAAVRYNFSYRSNVSPVLSFRAGSYISENNGLYADLGFGVRFASKHHFAISVMLTGTFYEPSEAYNYRSGYYEKMNRSGAGIRIGMEL